MQTTTKDIKTLQKVLKDTRLFHPLIEFQIIEFKNLRKIDPNILHIEAIKTSLLQAAQKLNKQKYSSNICFVKTKYVKTAPVYEWLLDHEAFIFTLNKDGASLRQITAAIFYRFHKKISHTQISKFLKSEGK